jgi:hypothetical protein
MTRISQSGSDPFQDALRAYVATFPGAGLPFLLIDIDRGARPKIVVMLRRAVCAGQPLERDAILHELGFHPPQSA